MNKDSIPVRLYKHSKVKLNYILDRIIQQADMVLIDGYQLPWPAAQNVAKKTVRYIGNLSWLLRDFPRLDAYKLTGPDWAIVFVGRKQGLLEICHLFFADETITPQEIGRVTLWRLSAQTQKWLAKDADLVICELSCICPNRPQAPLTFAVSTWIRQVLALPEPLEDLLLGNRMRSVRYNLKRAQKANFAWYFSQTRQDFEYFHYNMYQPLLKSRHGERALITNYQDQWRCWSVRGGLIVITQNNTRVGGLLCCVKGHTCYALEFGVLDGNPDLIQQGIRKASEWFTINWGYQQGARIYDMGGTRPWRSNGVFIYKSRWRAKVVRQKKCYGAWTFLAQNLSPSLQAHINRLGFISEIDGKFCDVLLSTEAISVTESDIDKELLAVEKQGLDGLVIVSANNHQVIPCKQLKRQ